MVFYLDITNIWQKFRDFWFTDFFLGFLKFIGWCGFHIDFWLFWMFFINVLFKAITNRKFYKLLSKTTFKSIFVSKDGVFLCAKEIHRLGPMDLKIYSPDRNPQLWLDSWQSLETFAKITSVTSISGITFLYQGAKQTWRIDPSGRIINFVWLPLRNSCGYRATCLTWNYTSTWCSDL